MPVRSLVRQTLHYFSRPHEGLPPGTVDHPAAWYPQGLSEQHWRHELTAEQLDEIEGALAVARAKGKSREALRAKDFPLAKLRHDVARWRRELVEGRGFLVIRGLPVDRWSEQDAETFFWCLGRHLGICGAQNPEGDLLGHVRDQRTGADDVTIRAYRTNIDIAFHCDAADAVGLMCLRAARHGGRSRIASSVTIFNELQRRHPELVPRLFEPLSFDTKAEGGLRFFPISPCAYAAGDLKTFYHSDYFREVERHPDAPRLGETERALLDAYDSLADEHCLEMDFRPGDVQLLSNHHIVHARTAYEDHDESRLRRHLLRLWLSFPRQEPLKSRWLTARSRARLLADLLSHRVAQR
jgi:hypothetical protein